MAMTPERATEHLRDGADCISECLKTIERVRKNFPELGSQIGVAAAKLQDARKDLDGMRAGIESAGTQASAAACSRSTLNPCPLST